MKPAQVKVGIAVFAYGGNGGTAMLSPELAFWLMDLDHKLRSDPRIHNFGRQCYSDTPITLTRNLAVEEAKAAGCDMLLMLDNDNEPDGYLGRYSQAKPFWDVAFDFAYNRLQQGIPSVVMAPYCGPPPHPVGKAGWIDNGEVPYLFQWANREGDNPSTPNKLELMTRNEAAKMAGLCPIAAGPTGVSLFTLNAFDGLKQPHFYYEWNENHTQKKSTEDVSATRDISMFWKVTKGYDVLWAACDSWALHVKPKRVGRPQVVPLESVAESFREACEGKISVLDEKRYIDCDKLPRRGQVLSPDQDQVYLSDEDLEQAKILCEREGLTDEDMELPEEGTDLDTDIWEPTEDSELYGDGSPIRSYDGNGSGVTYKTIGGRKCAVIDAILPDEAVESIQSVVSWFVDKKGSPLEVAVVGSHTGQATAAILSQLPDGSHIYALDGLKDLPQVNEHFHKTFKPDIESGRIMADTDGRTVPKPATPQHLDMVFIDCAEQELDYWAGHVAFDGLLAGSGNPLEAQQWATANGYGFQSAGGVWAIPMSSKESA